MGMTESLLNFFSLLAPALEILLKVVGGLGIFMLGMKFLSEGIQTVAGPSLRQMVSRVTDNRFLATGTGTTFTLLVQSSSIATVVMVGLVNAGLMQLHQAVGFIMGANIGTTITGWILIFKVGEFGLPVLGVAALVYVFSRRDRLRFISMAVMGLGMVFFGLQLMKDGVAPLKEMEHIYDILQKLKVESYLGIMACVALGCLLTFLVQSSSAALGILIAAASEGLVSFPVAAAFILGENIGTTITVVIASLGTTTNAKRAAYAHVLFNLIGVAWVVALFPVGIHLVAGVIQWFHGVNPMTMTYAQFAESPENTARYAVIITASIATVHTSFNVTNTLVFLPFVPQFARFLEWLVPAPPVKEVPHLQHLSAGSVDSPTIGIEQSRREIIVMGQLAVKMMDDVRRVCLEDQYTDESREATLHREKVLDNIEREVVAFLTQLLQSTVPISVVQEGRAQLRLAHEIESISDHLAMIVKDFRRLRTQELELPPDQIEELSQLHDKIRSFLGVTVSGYETRQPVAESDAKAASREIMTQVKELRERQIQRVVNTDIAPGLTMTYTGLLTHYRRIRGHILNAHQAIIGSKTQPRL